MAEKKCCPFCAAEYSEELPACPYCGATNIKGAEAEYLAKLEDMRSSMESLNTVPAQVMKKELKGTLRFVWRVLAVVAILVLLVAAVLAWVLREPERDPQADYLWIQTNYPVLNKLYEERDFGQLAARYRTAVEEDRPIYDWEHSYFCGLLEDVFYVEQLLSCLAEGEELKDTQYEDLVYYGWKFDGSYIEEYLSAQEQELLAPYIESYLEDFHARWEFTEKERAAFAAYQKEHYGYPSFELCEDYIKRWKKEQRRK